MIQGMALGDTGDAVGWHWEHWAVLGLLQSGTASAGWWWGRHWEHWALLGAARGPYRGGLAGGSGGSPGAAALRQRCTGSTGSPESAGTAPGAAAAAAVRGRAGLGGLRAGGGGCVPATKVELTVSCR